MFINIIFIKNNQEMLTIAESIVIFTKTEKNIFVQYNTYLHATKVT